MAANAKPVPKHSATSDKIEHMEAQPRRSHNALIPEYREIKTFFGIPEEAVSAIKNWQQTGKPNLTWQGTPIGKGFGLLSDIKDGRTGLSRIEIGFPWTTEEFTELARECKHPFDKDVKVPPAVAKAMASIAKLGPSGIAEKRKGTLKFWMERKAELEEQEEALKKKLDPEVRRVTQPKAILLFSEMLQSIHYDDMAVVELLTTGIKVGPNPKAKPPPLT